MKPSQAARIDKMRGRLTRPEFLRDRAFAVDNHYEPSIAAIGELYLLSGQLTRNLPSIGAVMMTLVRLETMVRDARKAADGDSPELTRAMIAVEAAYAAMSEGWEPLVNDAAEIAHLARQMGAIHLAAIHARNGGRPIRKKRVTR